MDVYWILTLTIWPLRSSVARTVSGAASATIQPSASAAVLRFETAGRPIRVLRVVLLEELVDGAVGRVRRRGAHAGCEPDSDQHHQRPGTLRCSTHVLAGCISHAVSPDESIVPLAQHEAFD